MRHIYGAPPVASGPMLSQCRQIWEYCFYNEFFGILVTTCGCYEAGRLYKNLSVDDNVAAAPSMVNGKYAPDIEPCGRV